MKEVSCRATALLLDLAERQGVRAAELLRDLPVPEESLRDRSKRVDWAVWSELSDRLCERLGGLDGMVRMGIAASELPVSHEFKQVARLFASPRRLYHLNSRWAVSSDFRNMRSSCVDVDDRRVRVSMSIDGRERGSLAVFHMAKGILMGVPLLLGLPAAHVDAEITPHAGVYTITPPRAATLWARARRTVGMLAAAGGVSAALEQLQVQQQEIVDQNQELTRQVRELRRVEDALRVSEQRWRSLVTHMPGAHIFVVGRDGRIELTNLPGEHEGDSLLERVTVRSRAALAAALERVAATGSAPDLELEALGDDDQPRTYLARLSALGEAVLPGSLIVLLTDVTDRKRAEEALHSSTEQLRRAQKLEAVGRLAGGVAHDFNNLLTVILTSASFLATRPGIDRDSLEDLRELEAAAQRGAQLTRQLLAVSRQDARKPTAVDLNDVIGESDKMLRRVIGEDILLVLRPGADIGRAMLDPGQIHQVILNLAVNARAAMPEGGTLSVETARVDVDASFAHTHLDLKPGPHVMLAVSDTGTGMSPEVQARIFEPFFTTKGTAGGTGLGLSIVRGIVEQSGGSIVVYSEPGIGTTLRMYFPCREDALSLPEPLVPSTGLTTGSETILLAEDEAAVRRASRAILSARGYHVLEAAGAEEAVQVAEQYAGGIDLLVTDVIMPRMSGRALAEVLVGRRPGLRVLYVSGYAEHIVVSRGVVAEGVRLLQKPFSPDALARRVREVLDADFAHESRREAENDA